jgi:hypothetical protein
MNDLITYRAFFGDRDCAFTLTDPMLTELERLAGLGAGAIYARLVNLAYSADLLREIIRLGLIGGGTSPVEAQRLCDTYAANRPITETFPLAFEIMEARWNGSAPDAPHLEVTA